MKFIDDEDKEKLLVLGEKIQQMKRLNEELLEFFIKDGLPRYEGTQEILDIIKLYIRGENPDLIGESVFQTDGKPVIELLKKFGLVRIGDRFVCLKL